MSEALVDELEAMAGGFSSLDCENSSMEIGETAQRWQVLFRIGYEDAVAAITQFRAEVNRVILTDAQWRLMADNTSAGHDKESFEYYLDMQKHAKISSSTSPTTTSSPVGNPGLRWIFRPIRPLETIEKIQDALGLYGELETLKDEGSTRTLLLCTYDQKCRIVEYLDMEAPHAKPTFVEHSMAAKDLSSVCAYPTLGVDTTLPQFRADANAAVSSGVQQNDFPVLYFFYGSLADPARLARLLNLADEPRLEKASITGGVLRTWKGSSGHAYKALISRGLTHDLSNTCRGKSIPKFFLDIF